MRNSIEEFFYKLSEWLNTKYATYGNVENTFSGNLYAPIIYDYIFYRTNTNKVLNKIKAVITHRYKFSVTRFGEISQLWRTVKNIWPF